MVALPVFDALLSSATMHKTRQVARQLIQSALTDLREIQSLEESVAPEDPLSFDRSTASSVRGMYEDWARSAEALLSRIAAVEQRSGPIEDSEALREALGRTRARLSVSLDQLEKGIRDISEGRTVPAEEVRRELRLRTG